MAKITMGIVVKIVGLPDLGRNLELEFCPPDIGQLIKTLIRKIGPAGKKFLIDRSGHLDPSIQVFVNHKPLARTRLLESHPLKQGDHVILMLMAAGG